MQGASAQTAGVRRAATVSRDVGHPGAGHHAGADHAGGGAVDGLRQRLRHVEARPRAGAQGLPGGLPPRAGQVSPDGGRRHHGVGRGQLLGMTDRSNCGPGRTGGGKRRRTGAAFGIICRRRPARRIMDYEEDYGEL